MPEDGPKEIEGIRVVVRLNDIETISDRTARAVFRDLSKLCRRVQVREAELLMSAVRQNRRQEQSIRDRMASDLEAAPVYYLKSAVAGSFIIEFSLGAAILWVLNATVGETVKESWKQYRIHKAVVEWVKDRAKGVPKIVEDEVKSVDFLSGRATATQITFDRPNVIEIVLMKPDYVEIGNQARVDESAVVAQAEKMMAELDARKKDR